MPPQLSYDFDGETVASLTREVAYLRATIARLRGAPAPRTAELEMLHAEHAHPEHTHPELTHPELSVVASAS